MYVSSHVHFMGIMPCSSEYALCISSCNIQMRIKIAKDRISLIAFLYLSFPFYNAFRYQIPIASK